MNYSNINIFLYFAINLFDVFVILHYYDKFLDRIKKYVIPKGILSILIVLLFTAFIRYELRYCNLVSLSVWSSLFLLFYKGERKDKIAYMVLLVVFAGFSQTIMHLIVRSSINSVYIIFVPHLLFFIIVEVVVRYQTVKNRKIDLRIFLVLLSVPIISFISMPCIVMISERTNVVLNQEITTLLMPIAILVLYMNILVVHLYDLISSSYEVKIQKEEYQKLITYQSRYYEELSENQNVIRKIRHDMQNNLQLLSEFLKGNMYDKAQDYLDELIDEHSKTNNIINTGNEAIDTVLNIKFSAAERVGISIQKDVNIPADLPLTYHDSIKIFANLIDNAINALVDVNDNEKKIKFFMFYSANALIIQISNPYVSKTIKHEKDSLWHGLGLGIVKDTIEEYYGTFEICDDGKTFTVNIIIYINDFMKNERLLQSE